MFQTSFIHLTDPHLVNRDADLFGLNPRQRFSAAIDAICAEHSDLAEFLVITGDLAHFGEGIAYEVLREELARLPMPVDLVIGNHDDRDVFRQTFQTAYSDANGFIQGWRDTAAGRMIFLDTVEMGSHAGAYCELRLRWLQETLDQTDDQVMLFMHHPPFEIGIRSLDSICLTDRAAIREVVRPHRDKVRHVFFGHVHRPISGSWMGIPMSTIYGTNHQVALNLDPSLEKIQVSNEGPAYALVLAGPDQVVIHQHNYLARNLLAEEAKQ